MNRLTLPLTLALGLAGPQAALAQACNEPGSITRVRVVTQGPFDYVIFKFRKPPNEPTYTVRAASPPFIQDGSGDTIAVAGDKHTEVQFRNVVWTCSIDQQLSLPKPAVAAVKTIGQFEGVITFIIGRKAAANFIANYSYDSGPGYRSVVVKYRR